MSTIDQIIQTLQPGFRRWQARFLAWLQEVMAQIVEELRPNPHPNLEDDVEHIGSFITAPAITAHVGEKNSDVKKRINRDNSSPFVFVSDSDGRFQGVVPVAKVFDSNPRSAVDANLQTVPSVSRGDAVRRAITISMENEAPVLAVTDSAGQLAGMVPAEMMLQLVHRNYGNTLKRFSGIAENSEQALTAIEGRPSNRVIHRLPWLLVGTFGSMIAAIIMAGFEDVLYRNIEVAFFIPGLVYLADAIGTQSEAIAVRGLTFSDTSIKSLWWGELQTGLLLGLTLAVLVFPVIWITFSASLAFAVALSLVFASSVATSIGLLFPWHLALQGKDPAFGSGPIATIIQDLLSLLIYFLTVSALVFD